MPTLSWNLDVDFRRSPAFSYNSSTRGTPLRPCFRPRIPPVLTQSTHHRIDPEQDPQAAQIAARTASPVARASPRYHRRQYRLFGPTDAGQQRLRQTVAEPVNVTSGEFYEDTVDLSLPGPLPLQLRRNYTSQNLQANEYGYGWKMNFNPFLVVASNIIYAAEMDGTVLAYRTDQRRLESAAPGQSDPEQQQHLWRGIHRQSVQFRADHQQRHQLRHRRPGWQPPHLSSDVFPR